MSYDLMVFDPDAAPKDRESFVAWYDKQTEWSEDHSYNDPVVSTPSLQAWFREMIQFFPPMSGPHAVDSDASEVTDHSVGKTVIYSAFAWSVAEQAYNKMRELAIKHRVGFFDVSSDDGEIVFPLTP
ncbi:hypothetical protein U8047_006750 [Pseudomonas aeruginosa]|uniref:Gcu199 n=1 Tax=Pseudomonas aeruginosa TaxID=287 RepID=A0A6M3GXS6_PSEAI|nr:hypothetical protein [Pseudomonas aeruginosa]EMB2825358.1 hypothetical protein [Pseudomonas aeruginosa]EMB2825665.1 hypothetical protein [Pseudomonas aeruginosa]QIM14581.1 Gcu199 [Pseudomonas aeruginosa]TYT32688.1 hypothetical protein FZC29_32285 [Pseudomonas aeruginosa]